MEVLMYASKHQTTSKWLKSNQLGYLESHTSTDSLVAASRKWVEECTGCLKMDKSFTEYLQDGVVLCELVQCLVPGIIRKINRIRNPFAWRENISFFLGACRQLGLRESQLFAPEDIIARTSSSNLYAAKSGGSDKVLRRVALTIVGLALELQSQHSYQGPCIQLGHQRPQPLQLSPEESQCNISDQEEAPIPSPNSLCSSLSSVQSPGSKTTRRVESVTSLITETSSTDIQSYAELVLYRNGSNKEYTCVSKPGPIRLTQSFNRASYSNKTARVHRTLSDRAPFTAKLPPDLLQESVSDIDIPALQNGGTEFGESRESFEEEYPEYRDFDSTTTPSDASTVIFRELPLSRCSSNLPVPGEECLVGGSYNSSPSSSRHAVATPGDERADSSPQVQRYSVDTSRSDSKTTPVGFEDSGAASPESEEKDIDSNSHENEEESIEATDSAVTESSEDPASPGAQEHEPSSNSTAVSGSTVSCNGADFPERKHSTEQVTDIFTSKINHTPSAAELEEGSGVISEDSTFCGDGIGFEQSLEESKKMESYMHYQHNGGPVVDSEPIGMNGVRTHGYASSDGKSAMYPSTTTTSAALPTSATTPAVDVPHHSLTLALSDPESPSSSQVPENGSYSSSRHQNFDVSSLAFLKNKNALPVGDLDLSRVQSDALPHSLLPSKVICENEEVALSTMLADARSVDTCSTDDWDRMSAMDSPRHSASPRHSLSPRHSASPLHMETSSRGYRRDREFSPGVSSIGEVEGVEVLTSSNNRRPLSAPNRSISTGAISLANRTLPASSDGPLVGGSSEDDRLRKKRKSLDVEQQRRTTNIQESTKAAFQYSAKRKDSRSETLPPRNSRSTSLSRSLVSTSSDNDLTSSGNAYFCKSSSPAVALPQHESSNSTASEATSTTPLNLRHLSIDQTKEASLTQMDEIWRQVEAIGDKPSQRREYMSTLLDPPLAVRTCVEDDRNSALSPSLDPAESGMESFDQDEEQSDVLRESDIVISVMEPIDQSTPLRPHPQEEGATGGMGFSITDPSMLAPRRTESHGNKLKRPPSFSNQDIDSLLDTLKSLSYNEDVEDLKILEDMLKSNTFKKAKQVHDDMQMLLCGKPTPAMHRILPSTQLMRQHLLHHTEQSSEVEELRDLLRCPHVQAALFCHDKVSSHDLYVPDANFHRTAHDPVDIILSASVDNFQATGRGGDSSHYHVVVSSRDVPFNRKEGATVVFLERTNRPLGCTIYKQEDSVFIGKLLKGCDAEASDMLREGDELLEVNGISVTGKRTDEIIRLMSGDVQPGTTLAFTIIPVHDESYDIDYEPKYMRAHFNYDGTLDDEIPCKALGLAFQKGDIMEIVNQDDPEWWQACKVFDENAVSLPGLVPSMHLQQQREALIHSYPYANTSHDTKKGLKGIFSRKKKKKIYYQNTTPSNILGIGDEIPTYEQVTRLEPDTNLCRPIVLIGAPGVGRRTLIRKLINSDPSVYHPVVQHTTRLVRPGEVNGHDYHFVSREEFERDIEQDRFLEYGEQKGHFHGTSFSAIKTIMESGRVPVLDLHPQALKKIRHSGVRPYIVFVASPRLERLQLTRKVGTEKLKRRLVSSPRHSSESESAHIYTESDLQHLVKESYLIEKQYGHYFDWIIVNDDFQVAADMLKEVSHRLVLEPQWVPYAWKNY